MSRLVVIGVKSPIGDRQSSPPPRSLTFKRKTKMKTKSMLTPFLLKLAPRSSRVRLACFITRKDRALAGISPIAGCAVERTEHRAPARTRTYHLMVQACIMLCSAAALVGCVTTNRKLSEASLNELTAQRLEPPSTPPVVRPVVMDERTFRSLDLNGDGTVTLDEWQHFDTSAAAKDNFALRDENGDGQINLTEFLTQALKHSKRYQFFGGASPVNDWGLFGVANVGPDQGWSVFSIRF
jgi:hypothetical protein